MSKIKTPSERLSTPPLVENCPSISVVIPTLNCAHPLTACLKSLSTQDYPKGRLDITIVDGGSSDDTLGIAASFGCKVISDSKLRQNQEGRRFLGLKGSYGDLVAFIDSDNVLPHSLWLRNMVAPFLEDKSIFAAETLWYGYSRDLPALTRYFALLGAIDPVVVSLGKADRVPYAQTPSYLGTSTEPRKGYYRVRFTPTSLPTVGANGYVARRDVLLTSTSSHEDFFHIDVNLDLVRAGFDTFAFVEDSIFHHTGNALKDFLRRRLAYTYQFLFRQTTRRRYKVYDPQFDRLKLLKHILFAFTFISPSMRAIKGYKLLPDRAWFLHPIVSALLTGVYCVCFASWLVETGGQKSW